MTNQVFQCPECKEPYVSGPFYQEKLRVYVCASCGLVFAHATEAFTPKPGEKH